jgi:hypothetical protein
LEKSAKMFAYYPTLAEMEAKIWSFGPHRYGFNDGVGDFHFSVTRTSYFLKTKEYMLPLPG